MSNKFIPHTEADICKMLERIGLQSVDDLYADVPAEVIFKRDYNIPSAMSEIELRKHFDEARPQKQTPHGVCRWWRL